MSPSTNHKMFLSRKEAAEVLNLSIPTISRRLSDGSIPCVRLGGRVLIPVEYIEQLSYSALNIKVRQ